MRQSSFEAFLRQTQAECRRMRKEEGRVSPYFLLDDKLSAYRFCDFHGFPRPRTDMFAIPLADLVPQSPCVIKPLGSVSSRGVFLLFSDTRVLELSTGKTYACWDEARLRARSLIDEKIIPQDAWVQEELLLRSDGTMAKDVKFYAFYGRTPLVLETQRQPEIRRCWYDHKLQPTTTGKYSRRLFGGTGIPPEAQRLAAEISLRIPLPFARIDLLISRSGIHLGEITPEPGRFNAFNDRSDMLLGAEMIAATARLACDISSGKSFPNFEIFASSRRIMMQPQLDEGPTPGLPMPPPPLSRTTECTPTK